jgi:hypothetical protein
MAYSTTVSRHSSRQPKDIGKTLVPKRIRTRYFPRPYHYATPLDGDGGDCGDGDSAASISFSSERAIPLSVRSLALSSTAGRVMNCSPV